MPLKISVHYLLLIVEGLILLLLTGAMWYDNTIRPDYFWLFWLAIPIFTVRWHLTGRLWSHTRMHDLIIVFILVTAFNYSHAIFQKESYLAATARPLASMWTFVYLVDLARTTKRITPSLTVTLGMSLVLSCFALTMTQWDAAKMSILSNLTPYIPTIDYRTVADQFQTAFCLPLGCINLNEIIRRGLFSFNPNESGGTLAIVTPFLGALTFIKHESDESHQHTLWTILRIMAGIGFVIAVTALIFGQSRFAITGVFLGILLVILLGMKSHKARVIAGSVWVVLLMLQLSLLLNIFTPAPSSVADTEAQQAGLSARDERSVNTRLQIWSRSLDMMRDQPMTGVGMYMFRTAVAQEPYAIPYFQQQNRPPPHGHNHWFHIAAETGLPGLLVYLGIQGIACWMFWYIWRNGDATAQIIAIGSFAGLLAYSIYGIGDTIALWDRYQFVAWWMLGLIAAQYVLTKQAVDGTQHEMTVSKI